MQEKWQEALGHWHEWTESVAVAQHKMGKEHSNLMELVSGAKIDLKDENRGDHTSIRFLLNDEMKIVWDIDEKFLKQAKHFVSSEIRLKTDSDLYYLFVDYWMQSVFPEFRVGDASNTDYYQQEDVGDRSTWAEYKTINEGQPDEDIQYTVHWRQSKIEPSGVAKTILKAEWPSNKKDLPKGNKGGRHRNPQIPLQAVVCFQLKNKEGMKHKEIAGIFGWKTYFDSNKNLMSNTVKSRIKLGARILGVKRK